MRISVSVEYQLPMPRPPISRVPTAFTSSTLPGFTPGMVWSVAGPGGVDAAGGVSDGAAVGGLLCGLDCGLLGDVLCAYPVSAIPGANSKLLATRNSAGISFLPIILFIATSVP